MKFISKLSKFKPRRRKRRGILGSELNLTCPKGWAFISRRELKFILRLLPWATSDALKNHFFIFATGIKVVGRNRDGRFLIKHNKEFFLLPSEDLAAHLPTLAWLDSPPDFPVCLPQGPGGKRHVSPTLSGVPFSQYLRAENLWQGFVASKGDFHTLKPLVRILYPGARWPLSKKRQRFWLYAVMLWYSGLKGFLARQYPDLFGGTSGKEEFRFYGSQPSAKKFAIQMMNAQIRALTKGDITLEERVLSMDTHRALAELDAQARENAQMEREMNNAKS